MKRRFAIPAAITLAAHAILFLGSGRPPATTQPEETPQQVIALVPELPAIIPDVVDHRSEISDSEVPSIERVVYTGISFETDIGDRIIVEGTWAGPVKVEAEKPDDSLVRKMRSSVVNVTMLDRRPRIRQQIAPEYPLSLKSLGLTGEVLVEFMVDELGRVYEARVLRSSHADFEAPTLQAVGRWRFEPGRRQGVPVRFRMSVPVVFKIE